MALLFEHGEQSCDMSVFLDMCVYVCICVWAYACSVGH